MPGDRPQILVVGGGLVGRSIGLRLCQRGFAVRVIDAGSGPSVTSRGALGVLTHYNGGDNPLSRLYRASHACFAELADELREISGIDIGWREVGGLDLIFADADAVEAAATLAWNRARGCPVEELSAAEVLRREPAVAPGVRGGLFFPGDHRVDPEALSEALGVAIARCGGALQQPERALRIRSAGSGGLVVQTDMAEYRVDHLVLAAGAWTRELAAQVGATVPVRPIRGQHARAGGPGPRCVLRHGGRHLVPARGATLVGATVEEVGFDTATTPEALADFAAAWRRMVGSEPALGEQRAGLRPKPKGGRPLIGPLRDTPRVFVATGHYKNGVLMAPMTGHLVASWIATGAPPWDMSYFRPER